MELANPQAARLARASGHPVTVATWWSPLAGCSSTVCDGVFASGSSVMWCA